MLYVFAKKKAWDQKAAKNKKKIHSNPSRIVGVIYKCMVSEKDKNDSYTSQKVYML